MNMHLSYRNRIWKVVKKETTERIELPNQESLRTLAEEENYKDLVILETFIIKQKKNEIKKNVSQKNEKISPN